MVSRCYPLLNGIIICEYDCFRWPLVPWSWQVCLFQPENELKIKEDKSISQNAFQTTRFFCSWRVAVANWLYLRPLVRRSALLSLSRQNTWPLQCIQSTILTFQLYFHFLNNVFHCQCCCSGWGANVRLRPHGFLTFLLLDCLRITFTFMQSESFLASGHQQGGVTKLGKFTPPSTGSRCLKSNFLYENQSFSSPLHLLPLWAPPAGCPPSFWWCWRRARGTSILVTKMT